MTDAECKKWMNTVSHEVRHQYQTEVQKMKKKVIPPAKDMPGYMKSKHEQDARQIGNNFTYDL